MYSFTHDLVVYYIEIGRIVYRERSNFFDFLVFENASSNTEFNTSNLPRAFANYDFLTARRSL